MFIELCTQVFINLMHIDGFWGLHMFAPKNSVPHLDAVSSDSLIGNDVVSWWRNSEKFSSCFCYRFTCGLFDCRLFQHMDIKLSIKKLPVSIEQL